MLPDPLPESADVLDMATVSTLRSILDSGLDELFQDFIKDTPADIEKLYQAAINKDITVLAQIAHYLKGSGGNIGAKAFADICYKLEQDANEGNLDKVEDLVLKIEQIYQQTCTMMQEIMIQK